MPFNENIGLLTPNEVKKLEKYGKIVNVDESERELELQQEALVETMPEDNQLILLADSSSQPVQGNTSMSSEFDVLSRGKASSFKIKGMANEELNIM